MSELTADVLLWGPILRNKRWKDLEDSDLEDSINWVLENSPLNEGFSNVRIHIKYVQIKEEGAHYLSRKFPMVGGGTIAHAYVVSDQPLTEEEALAVVKEAQSS